MSVRLRLAHRNRITDPAVIILLPIQFNCREHERDRASCLEHATGLFQIFSIQIFRFPGFGIRNAHTHFCRIVPVSLPIKRINLFRYGLICILQAKQASVRQVIPKPHIPFVMSVIHQNMIVSLFLL